MANLRTGKKALKLYAALYPQWLSLDAEAKVVKPVLKTPKAYTTGHKRRVNNRPDRIARRQETAIRSHRPRGSSGYD